jgi:hypothetical protein
MGLNERCNVTCPYSQQRHAQTSPLQALVHEFLETPAMAWLKEAWKPMDFEKWLKRYPEQRRVELREGRDTALQYGLLASKHARVQNFLKTETTTNATDPRNISPREEVFMAVLGPFIAAIEKLAHKAPFLVKGMNLRKRNRKMAKLLTKKRFIEIDFSRFDMTIGEILLEIERTIMTNPFPREYFPELHEAYDKMMKTLGASLLGTLYARLGGRNSGDLTTSIGNGGLNYFSVWMCLRKLPEGSWVSYHEGDDGVIGVDEEYLDQALENLQFLWALGLQPKMDVYTDINQTSFCGRFLAETPEGLQSYCDPLRTLSKIHTTCAQGDKIELMCAKMLSYACTDGETPVVGPYAFAISEVLRQQLDEKRLKGALVRLLKSNELPWFYAEALRLNGVDKALSSRPRPIINEELRAVFALRTGITIKEQLDLEDIFWAWLEAGEVRDDLTPRELPYTLKPNVWYSLDPY